jgi:hypothetical protein
LKTSNNPSGFYWLFHENPWFFDSDFLILKAFKTGGQWVSDSEKQLKNQNQQTLTKPNTHPTPDIT